MLSSEKFLKFFPLFPIRNYPQQKMKHLHNSMQDSLPFIHGKTREIQEKPLHKQQRDIKIMRKGLMPIFPHYPQSYPQNPGKRTAFFLRLPKWLWITPNFFRVIHRKIQRSVPIFPQVFPLNENEKKIKFASQNRNKLCGLWRRKETLRDKKRPRGRSFYRGKGRG